MFLIMGLGNPTKKYESTRHNLGFRVLDLLAPNPNEVSGAGLVRWENKYNSEFLKLDDVILAKPQTFMNKSGEAVKEILKFYPDAQLVVIHDDLDFPLGSIKIQKNSSGAGHNGVQNIIEELGSQDFIRIRLGIDSPARGQIPSEDYVLQKFSPDEEITVTQTLEKTKDAVELIQTQGLEIAQSRYNG